MDASSAASYLAGAVLLGAAPCAAMVFVWSKLTKGDGAYTLVQVASNDLIILVAFVPIVSSLKDGEHYDSVGNTVSVGGAVHRHSVDSERVHP